MPDYDLVKRQLLEAIDVLADCERRERAAQDRIEGLRERLIAAEDTNEKLNDTLETMKAVTRWKSVMARKPPQNRLILTRDKKKTIRLAKLNGDHWLSGDTLIREDIVEWMAIPDK